MAAANQSLLKQRTAFPFQIFQVDLDTMTTAQEESITLVNPAGETVKLCSEPIVFGICSTKGTDNKANTLTFSGQTTASGIVKVKVDSSANITGAVMRVYTILTGQGYGNGS